MIKIKERITKDEYVLEVLKDDLKTRRYKTLNKCKAVIKQADLFSYAENLIRSILISSNGGIGNQLDSLDFSLFYKETLNKEEFLRLYWCPKGNNKKDGIDEMSNGTRKIVNILRYLKNDKNVPEDQKDFFDISLDNTTNLRLFLFHKDKKRYIIDGNHRAGAVLRSLSKKEKKGIFPILSYVAKIR